ncbi:MAG TPA: hypothetical protein VGZ27_16375 [Vicinamibacterales bacterium]|nr:hypothetical protein [Vicinamibacterales bacterium]
MGDLRGAIALGRYARHQLFSPSRLIAWSHRRRFATQAWFVGRLRPAIGTRTDAQPGP